LIEAAGAGTSRDISVPLPAPSNPVPGGRRHPAPTLRFGQVQDRRAVLRRGHGIRI